MSKDKFFTYTIDWTVFGFFKLHGKEEYDAAIESPDSGGSPKLQITRMVEEDDVVMAEPVGEAPRKDGSVVRLAMGEVFVMKNGLIDECRAYVIELKENDYK